ncbi:hypothetical protein C8J57DRAFT_1294437 [Mycena rebaudengoi]|nr:hypothetical protein C8J57DRAFT_1294437 [Mycena rebaudengoi]
MHANPGYDHSFWDVRVVRLILIVFLPLLVLHLYMYNCVFSSSFIQSNLAFLSLLNIPSILLSIAFFPPFN